MSWIRGTTTNYLTLSDAIVAAATGLSIVTVDSVSAGGTGYVVGEIITFTTGTFTEATQLEVLTLSGSAVATVRVYNAGVYTVAPSDSNATTSSGSGTGATFTHTYGSNGWTADRDTTWSGSDKEVIMHGNGSGSDAIYIGWRTFNGSGYFNFELHGMTGYDIGISAGDIENQPGVSPGFHDLLTTELDGCYLLCHNTTLSYWFNINSYRIIIVIKVGSAYFNAYLGFGNRFGTTSEYPYPLLVMGHTSSPTDPSTQTKLSSGLTDPWADTTRNSFGPGAIMGLDNNWYAVKNATVSISNRAYSGDVVVIPAQRPSGTTLGSTPASDKFMGSNTSWPVFDQIIPSTLLGGNPTTNTERIPGTVTEVLMLPATVVMSVPSTQILVELDEVFWISSFNDLTSLVTEDRVIDGTDVYRAFQNCNRTDPYAFLVVKEA